MKLGQELAAIRPAPSLKAYSIHLGDIQGNRRKACPSKLPARESWLLSLQKIGSEMVSLAPLSFPSDLAGPAAHETLLLCGCVVGTEVGILLVRLSPNS